MNARSALFDLFGDHLRGRGDQAPIAGLVALLAPLDVAAPAVRTAVSRMVRQGWLQPVRIEGAPGYGLTPRAVRRLDDVLVRVYRTTDPRWDGRWHLLTVELPTGRASRDRLLTGLRFLGYGPLDPHLWVATRRADGQELAALVAAESADVHLFVAEHDGDDEALVRRAWNLEAIGAAYDRFVDDAVNIVDSAGPAADDERQYMARFRLVHAWRKLLFIDPGLPPGLLPGDWAGAKAAAFFDSEAARLQPASVRYVDRTLAGSPPTGSVSAVTSTDEIRYSVVDAVATITLNRPRALNAMTAAMKEALLTALGQAAHDEAVRAVVLTGAGRAFCAGQDLGETISDLDSGAGIHDTVVRHFNPLVIAITGLPKPVIAGVNGVAAGAGASLAFAADFRVAAESASFLLAFARIGLSLDGGSSWTLQRLVGAGRATEIAMLAEPVSAARALEIGLVNQVVPSDELSAAVADLARRLAAGPTVAYGLIKHSLAHSATSDLPSALAVEAECQRQAARTEDAQEAIRAFVDKRQWTFSGS